LFCIFHPYGVFIKQYFHFKARCAALFLGADMAPKPQKLELFIA